MGVTDNYKKHTHWNPIQRFLIGNFYNTIFSLCSKLDSPTILDVGCGEGFTLNNLHIRKIGQRLEGIEYSKEAIAQGKKMHPAIAIKYGSIYKLPYKDNSFDLVICTEVLEHLESPQKALLELVRVSKKYLLLSVPNEPLFMLANFIRGKNWSRFGNDVEHIRHWSSSGFEQFVKREKLQILSKKHPFAWTIIVAKKF